LVSVTATGVKAKAALFIPFTFPSAEEEARMAQLAKSPDSKSQVWTSLPTLFVWYGPLVSPSLETASVGLYHHGKI